MIYEYIKYFVRCFKIPKRSTIIFEFVMIQKKRTGNNGLKMFSLVDKP